MRCYCVYLHDSREAVVDKCSLFDAQYANITLVSMLCYIRFYLYLYGVCLDQVLVVRRIENVVQKQSGREIRKYCGKL